jgi:Peroxidase
MGSIIWPMQSLQLFHSLLDSERFANLCDFSAFAKTTMTKSSLALFLVAITFLVGMNVQLATACPYLDGNEGGSGAQQASAKTRGAISSRQLESRRAQLGDRLRKFVNRLRGKSPPAPPPPPAPAPVSPPKNPPVAVPSASSSAPRAPVTAPVVSAPVAASPTTTSSSSSSSSVAQVIAAARAEIVTLLAASPPNTALAAKFVRLSFHDCVGGCDGCVDMNDLDNGGLDIPMNALQPIVTKYTQGSANASLTRADVWA